MAMSSMYLTSCSVEQLLFYEVIPCCAVNNYCRSHNSHIHLHSDRSLDYQVENTSSQSSLLQIVDFKHLFKCMNATTTNFHGQFHTGGLRFGGCSSSGYSARAYNCLVQLS